MLPLASIPSPSTSTIDIGPLSIHFYGPVSDLTAPTAPTGFTATGASGSSMLLEWTSSTDNVAVAVDLDQYFSDANGDTLSFTVGTLPAWLSYNATTHVLSGTPPVDNVGSFPVSVTVCDPGRQKCPTPR